MDSYWNPYVLRHSKLTEYAKSVPDQVLKNYAGWTPDSPMTSRYIHQALETGLRLKEKTE